jgi:hypothetical protein
MCLLRLREKIKVVIIVIQESYNSLLHDCSIINLYFKSSIKCFQQSKHEEMGFQIRTRKQKYWNNPLQWKVISSWLQIGVDGFKSENCARKGKKLKHRLQTVCSAISIKLILSSVINKYFFKSFKRPSLQVIQSHQKVIKSKHEKEVF